MSSCWSIIGDTASTTIIEHLGQARYLLDVDSTFIIDFTVTVDICLLDYLVHLLVGEPLAQVVHHLQWQSSSSVMLRKYRSSIVKIVELYWPVAAPGRWWTRSRPCQTPGMPPLSPPCWNQRINEHFITNSIIRRTSSSSSSWLPLPRRWCYRCGAGAGAGAQTWRSQEAGGARSLCSRNGINNN